MTPSAPVVSAGEVSKVSGQPSLTAAEGYASPDVIF